MSRQRLLLVGWDSADWKIMHPMIDAGHWSGVARLVEAGLLTRYHLCSPRT